MIDNNEIVWICPKCQQTWTEPKGVIPHGDGHCTTCPGMLVETKYTWGEYFGEPGYTKVDREKFRQEYLYNNEQYDPKFAKELYNRQYNGEPFKSKQTKNVPKCPTCGSTNISDIGTLERGVSVGLFGLFSGKIGKTKKCNHCGYKW